MSVAEVTVLVSHQRNIPLQGAGVPEWLIHEDWALLQVFRAVMFKLRCIFLPYLFLPQNTKDRIRTRFVLIEMDYKSGGFEKIKATSTLSWINLKTPFLLQK